MKPLLQELTVFKLGTPAFTAYTTAYHTAAALLKHYWPDPAKRPKLMGPCPGMSWPQLASWFPAFLKGQRCKQLRSALDLLRGAHVRSGPVCLFAQALCR